MMMRMAVHKKDTRESRCIICGEEKNGLEVKEDNVIKLIRYFKRNVTRNEKNYRLIVCRQCYPKYSKERSSFMKRMTFYVGIGVVFGIIAIVVAPLNIASYVIAAIVICLMYLFSLLSYMPAITVPQSASAKTANGKIASRTGGQS
jgi:hypothetical protein